ncbi:MAG: AAA family ATPase [Candidatus Ancaeobacter aquaticus]|nr:AAA family ATPase [Candidatus Ancaeobacter aquaticus]
MIEIKKIEIYYFRSIYSLKNDNLKDLTIYAGKNDIGKSNILKALNLFFNGKPDWDTAFDFKKDFSYKRKNESIKLKTRQFIRIAIRFKRGDRYQNSLPEEFTITRTWYRNSPVPDEKNSLMREHKKEKKPKWSIGRANASLQRYLNTMKFEYIPAIKDNLFFAYMLGRLQHIIFAKGSNESTVKESIEGLNSTISSEIKNLQEEFALITKIDTQINLPEKLSDLFKAFTVSTKEQGGHLPLQQRGDGIRTRFIPSLLHHISQNSKLYFIWGFEEPENNLEYSLAIELAEKMAKEYSRDSQIFITTHSPAFFSLTDKNVTVYRVFKNDIGTACINLAINSQETSDQLWVEMGLMEFQIKSQNEYRKKLDLLKKEQEELEKIRKESNMANMPVLLTEGKWDELILNSAWSKLYPNQKIPFKIICSDPYQGASANSFGGVDIVKRSLESTRKDQEFTVGLFDRDVTGYNKGFKGLSNNFSDSSFSENVKIHKAGTSAAIVLPAIESRREHAAVYNLEIEFYFDDPYLQKKIEKKGLELKPRLIKTTVIGTSVEEIVNATEPHLFKIVDSTKKYFAEKIVPTLPKEAFINFEILFDLINTTMNYSKKSKHNK